VDIHKPKPWHGFREFLKEYLIIVVGVLTALGGEQAVEAIHWAERAHQTEERLRDDVHELTVQVAGRLEIQPCANAMLDRLQAALEQGGEDWRAPVTFRSRNIQGVVIAPKGDWGSEDWQAAITDGTTSHMSTNVVRRFRGAFVAAEALQALNKQETVDMSELNSLISIRRLDPGSRAEYLRLVYRVRQNLLGMDIMSHTVLQAAKGLGVKPGTLSEYGGPAMRSYQEICRQFSAGKTEIVL
jgi:hypothetical protein